MEHVILIEGDTLTAIYSDEIRDLLEGGDAEIKRASHVEPDGMRWNADMTPAGGPPQLDPDGFETRAEALAAEVEWLKANLLN